MKNVTVAIVDTVGNPQALHPNFVPRFPWVSRWLGYESQDVAGQIPHPHGSMCAEKILQPLHATDDAITVAFIRIFDGHGGFLSSFAYGEALNTLRELRAGCDALYVNNSWGGYVGSRGPSNREEAQAGLWRQLIQDTGATVFWAAGNDGDYDVDADNDMPQSILTDVSHKVASHDRRSLPSSFSSDSPLGPPLAALWAEDVQLLNGVLGIWEKGSGTSFACPKLCGLAAALDLDFAGVSKLALDFGRRPEAYAAMSQDNRHPKWGLGSLEGWYQRKIVGSPALQDASLPMVAALDAMPRTWFGYRRL